MSKVRKRVFFAVVLGLSVGWLSVYTASAAEPLLVGSVEERTGWGGVYVTPKADVILAYAERINRQGGIHGRPIKIIQYDNESKVELTHTYVRKLIEKDKVLLIEGPEFSANCWAAIEAAKGSGTPLIYGSPGPRPTELSMPGSGIFALAPPDWIYIHAVLSYLKEKLGVQSIGVMATTDESGTEDVKYAESSAEKLDLVIALVERFSPKAIDVSSQLAKIKAADVDGIFIGGGGSAVGPLMKGIKLLGLDDIPVAGVPGMTSKEMFVLIKGYEPKKFVLPCMRPQVPAFNVLPTGHALTKIADRYWDFWESEWGESRGDREEVLKGWGFQGWESMELIVETLKQAGPNPDRETINQSLENKIVGFEQMWGRRTMTPTDHCGIAPESLFLLTIKSGKIALLE